MKKSAMILVFASLLLPRLASAQSCSWNMAKDFYSCDNFGIWQSVGRSFSSQTEILNISPAALPAMFTPVGIEGVVSNRTDTGKSNRAHVSLIKGFNFFGIGLSTLDIGTFSQADLGSLFEKNLQYQKAYDDFKDASGVLRGTQFGLSVMPPLGPISRLLHLQAGASVAKSNSAGRASPTYGFSADLHWFSFGYSIGRQTIAGGLPDVRSAIWNLGLQLDGLYAAASHAIFHSAAGSLSHTTYSLRWSGPHLNFFVAAKNYTDDNNRRKTRYHATVDGHVNSKLSAGYMYGLYQNSHSLFAQLFF